MLSRLDLQLTARLSEILRCPSCGLKASVANTAGYREAFKGEVVSIETHCSCNPSGPAYRLRATSAPVQPMSDTEVRAENARRAAARRREDERFRRGFMDYICAVNARVIHFHHVRGEAVPSPLLTPAEQEAMSDAFDHDVQPTDFVVALEVARDDARKASELVS
ncbi:MAG TPA: hypothetical protein VIR54_31940 [Vicinamibacterales bacterium]|jgi:hypothetical protein